MFKSSMKINPSISDGMHSWRSIPSIDDTRRMFKPAVTLGANEKVHIAMDQMLDDCGVYNLINKTMMMDPRCCESYNGFLGYAFLSTLTQNGLIRAGVEAVADEMTRKWIKIKREGEATSSDDKIQRLNALMRKYNLQGIFHDAATKMGYFGGCLAYIDTGERDPEVLKTPLHLDPYTFQKGSLKRFTVIEPINIYPGVYNAYNPLEPDYFWPHSWWVLGQEIHSSRFLYFSANEIPILLRPSYNFFGISAAQTVLDYVKHFTETREAAARLLTKFSLTAFKTNMYGVLQGGGDADLTARMQYFIKMKSNDGCMVIDKDSEDLMKLDTSLSGVDVIVRQALELIPAMFRITVVKYLGITPAGLNATGEADQQNFYDYVYSQQEKTLRLPLQRALEILQMNEWGEVDPNLSFEFIPLGEEDERAQADINKVIADTAAIYVDRGIISQEEQRGFLAKNPKSGYDNIDAANVPELPGLGIQENDTDEAGRVWG